MPFHQLQQLQCLYRGATFEPLCAPTHSFFTILYHIVLCTIYRDHEGFRFALPTYKPAKHLLCDSMAALVRHSQAQKCLQINSKPLH